MTSLLWTALTIYKFLITSWLCLQWLAQSKADTCVKSTQLTKGPGFFSNTTSIIRDRTPQSGNYASGVDCHWQITTPTANTIVSLSFTLLNLDEWLGTSNDVIMVNLGVGAPMPDGWNLYTRKTLSSGTDDIGYYSYDSTSPSKDTCVANQEGNFDPATCNLIYGTLLTDTTRSNSWYYYTGSYDDSENTMTLVSAAQDIYVIYRSFAKFSTLPQTTIYGFAATYSFVSAYCSGLTSLLPQLTVTSGANATAMQSFHDNMVGKTTRNMSCSWLIQPTRMDGKQRKSFDSIWIFSGAFDLAGNTQLTIYDGASSSDTVLAQYNRLNPFIVGEMIANSQGVMFITYQTFNSPISTGFTINWQAGMFFSIPQIFSPLFIAYCPKQCSGSHGSCIAGICYCNHGWAGAACDTPQGWLCDSTHYNTSDGCDCGCGIYDPDCGALTSSVLSCSSEPSLDNSAFNSTQGKHYTGRCLYCPLPSNILEQIPQPNLDWNTTDGSILQSCPLVQQCGEGSQCDAYGTCVSTSSISNDVIVKQCSTSADCPEATLCSSNNTCTTVNDYALLFSDPTLTAGRCMLLGMNILTGFTIEMTIQISSRKSNDVIFSYTDLSITTSSSLSITIGPDTWSSSIAIDDGLWHLIALTWESSTGLAKLYSYNSSSNTSTILATYTYPTKNFALNTDEPLTMGGFNGSLAYLRISNVICSTLTFFQPTTPANKSSVVAEYRFMDGSGRDLSIYQNHLNVSTLVTSATTAFGATPPAVNPCLLVPTLLPDHFSLGSALVLTAGLTGQKWSVGFLSASNTKIIQVDSLSSTLVQISVSGVSVANLSTSNIIIANATLSLRFEATAASTIIICIFEVTCTSVSYDPTTSLASLASTVSPLTLTTSGHYCTFPMSYTIRDCTKFQTYMTSKGYTNSMGNLVARSYAYANLDLSEQPCICSTMPAWASNAVLKSINSTSNAILIQITYITIKTKTTADSTTAPCSANCFIYDSSTDLNQASGGGGGGGGGGGHTQAIVSGTLANQYKKVRDFTFVKNGSAWQVSSVSSVGNVSPSLCVVTGADASLITNNISALSCLTTGASTLEAATPQPWCLVNSQQEICLAEVNSCNLPLGTRTLTNASGTITDGYVFSCTAGVHKCVFTIQPTVLSALRPYAQLLLTVQQLQLSTSDNVIITDLASNLTIGSVLSGSIDTSSLPILTSSIGSTLIEYDGYGDQSGQLNDGFVIEYDTFYTFPSNHSTHFCSLPTQTFMLNNDNHQVFPLYSMTSTSLYPNQTTCTYSFSTNNSSISSLWLSFLELNLTDTNGGFGDRLEIYSVNMLLNQSTLVANITNSSYLQTNYPISFNGATDYLKSTSLLHNLPITIAFWLYVPSTTKVDCSVSANCINNVPKPMKILGSSSRFSSAAYFAVSLSADTGYISLLLSDQQFTMNVNVMQDLWYHIALVYKPDQKDVFWYLNGQRQVSTVSGTINLALAVRGMTVYIGGQTTLPDTLNIYFSGQLKQMRLYEKDKRAHVD
ncbi:hypothetical protein THRCLA_22516 [Thraustotheca clavata]|uniref:CUB domain-containing protein n=1 Tax=Thraustotheca clavata TaxID=74557 RepID=A0A1V9YYH6_9STRA|nr:hypothetical protein THRCLA_22516 [Thraustotheca clavata]